MPESSRRDAPLRNPQYPQGAEREHFSPDPMNPQRQGTQNSLPPADIYGQLPRSRVEDFGRTLGFAVGNVLRFPQQAGSRLRHATRTTRAQASAAVLDMMDTAAQRAGDIGRTTGATLFEWTHSARRKTSRLEDQATERWFQLRSSAKERLDVARRRAVAQWNQTQRAVVRVQQEDPARFLAIVAGTAFVIGAGLRIWRSSSND